MLLYVLYLILSLSCSKGEMHGKDKPPQYRLVKQNGYLLLEPQNSSPSTFQSRSLPPSETEDKKHQLEKAIYSTHRYNFIDPITGSLKFGYINEMDYRHEVRTLDGVVKGRFGWKDASGKWHQTKFIADKNGYRTITPGNSLSLLRKPPHNQHSESDKNYFMKLKSSHIDNLKVKSKDPIKLGRPPLAHQLPLTDIAIDNSQDFGAKLTNTPFVKLPVFKSPTIDQRFEKPENISRTKQQKPHENNKISETRNPIEKKITVNQNLSQTKTKKPPRPVSKPIQNFSGALMAPIMNLLLGNMRKSQRNRNKTVVKTPDLVNKEKKHTRVKQKPQTAASQLSTTIKNENKPQLKKPLDLLNRVFKILEGTNDKGVSRPSIQYLQ